MTASLKCEIITVTYGVTLSSISTRNTTGPSFSLIVFRAIYTKQLHKWTEIFIFKQINIFNMPCHPFYQIGPTFSPCRPGSPFVPALPSGP